MHAAAAPYNVGGCFTTVYGMYRVYMTYTVRKKKRLATQGKAQPRSSHGGVRGGPVVPRQLHQASDGHSSLQYERSWRTWSYGYHHIASHMEMESGIAAPSIEHRPLLESPEDGSRWPVAPPASLGNLRLQCLRC
jgi:hypothetical protein